MKRQTGKILLLIMLFLFFGHCSDPEEELVPVEISGVVLNYADDKPVINAIVRIISPEPERVEQTDSSGAFLFELDVDSTMDLTLTTNKEGFYADTIEALAVPERNVELPTIYLFPLVTVSDDTTDAPSGPSSIILASISSSTITVIGSGGVENAAITFLVQDSTGIPVGSDIEVSFSVGSNPDGGEYVYPLLATTDEHGQATVNLVSGSIAGVVQILASVTVSGSVIQSQAVPITIHGGLPDQDHFGLISELTNFPGYSHWGRENLITAFVGDKYGNFCTPGTAVYFTTDGGIIEGSGLTSDGICSVTLVSSAPQPVHSTLGPGFATITAKTANDSSETIETSIVVLFSGDPVISDISPNTVNIPNGGSQDFTFTVTDENGNPLSGGTKVEVKVEGENVSVVGDVDNTLYDTQSTGYGITTFAFNVADNLADEVESPIQITISTTGLNGEARATITGSGF